PRSGASSARPADAPPADLPRDDSRGSTPGQGETPRGETGQGETGRSATGAGETGRRRPGSAPTPVRDEASQLPEGRKETLAERSQRLWEERRAGVSRREDESVRQARRRGVSAASPADAGAESSGRARSGEESGEDEAEEIDKTSSLSRPPKMPAIKRRPRDQE